jgi:photosystem II P680 reaction center D1 protein
VGLFSAARTFVTSLLWFVKQPVESRNYGYKFGQEETYNIVAAHGYFWSSPIRFLQQQPSASLLLGAWPVIGIWFTSLVSPSMAFNLERFQLQPIHHH